MNPLPPLRKDLGQQRLVPALGGSQQLGDARLLVGCALPPDLRGGGVGGGQVPQEANNSFPHTSAPSIDKTNTDQGTHPHRLGQGCALPVLHHSSQPLPRTPPLLCKGVPAGPCSRHCALLQPCQAGGQHAPHGNSLSGSLTPPGKGRSCCAVGQDSHSSLQLCSHGMPAGVEESGQCLMTDGRSKGSWAPNRGQPPHLSSVRSL